MDERKDISDEDDLYRRIPPEWYVEKEERISSAAFRHLETSVDWARYTTPEKTVAGFLDCRLAALQAKFPRSERAKNQKVIHDPEPNSYSHSLIIGKKTDSVARFLALKCRFVIKDI